MNNIYLVFGVNETRCKLYKNGIGCPVPQAEDMVIALQLETEEIKQHGLLRKLEYIVDTHLPKLPTCTICPRAMPW